MVICVFAALTQITINTKLFKDKQNNEKSLDFQCVHSTVLKAAVTQV